ncbi:SpoIIE family protein phosphatase [Nocardioides sp. CPCC 205120]|uniref:SpoIIE family protein phosphatase n=1 Tax=Nocardioides sp. CPCC 205120 TaxID=3406462 RepID=UPI003B5106D7
MTTGAEPSPDDTDGDLRAGGGRTTPFGSPGARDTARVERARKLAARRGGLLPLNRLAELAAQLLGVESAQVSVVADEQTVMGGAGVASQTVGVRTAAADSLCTVTVEAGAPVLVPDTTLDPRVRDLPAVTSGAIGSYLGVPLRAGDHVVGALCVFGREPRAWSDDDVALLQQLTGPAMTELELAALETSYEEDRVLWQLAVDAAGVGAFDWDLATGALRWDERLLALFGHDRTTFGGTIQAFEECVHPDDRARVGAALQEAIETCGEYEAEYRVVRPDGRLRWVAARGHAVTGEDGSAVRVVGAAYDTTAVREGEARVGRILEAMPTAFFQLDPEWRFTYANPEARLLLGGIGTDVVGHDIWELFPAARGTEFERHYRGSVASGEPSSFEAYYPPPLDDWYEVRCWPAPDGLSVYFLGITERRRAQELLARRARRAALLAEATKALTDTLDEEEAVGRLTKLLVPALGDWCVVTLVDGTLPDDLLSERSWRRRLRDVGWWADDPALRPLVERYAQLRVPALTDESLVVQALVSSAPVVVPEGAADRIASILQPGEATDICRRLAPSAAVVIPLRGRGRVAGLMSVFRGEGRETFTEEDIEVLADVAERAGLALDNASLYAGQRELAEGLQRSLLTAPPEPDHLEVVVRYEPAAEAAQVGGDWYDAFLQPDGATTLVIGDVIGHDTAAAAAMGQVRTLLRGIAVTTEEGPAAVLRRVDAAMTTLQVDTMATAVVARLEQTPQERAEGVTRLRWSNAGHPPPVVVVPTEDGGMTSRLLWADAANPMLGLLTGIPGDEEPRDDSVVVLPRGSTLLLYTDGLVERRGHVLDEGLEQLREVLTDLARQDLPLQELSDQLLHRMLPGWTEDDVAIVAVRLHPEDRPRPPTAGRGKVPTGVAPPPAVTPPAGGGPAASSGGPA